MMKSVNVWSLNWAARANSAFWCVVTCTSICSGLVSSTLLVFLFVVRWETMILAPIFSRLQVSSGRQQTMYVVLIVCIDSDPGARIPPPQRTIQG